MTSERGQVEQVATYHDIRRETGLSLATISKYFNGGNVLDANARAIADAAKRLDFQPNNFARNLRSRRTRSVGVLLPNLSSDFYLSILAGMERRLRARGVTMLICADHAGEGETEDAVDFLRGRMVDGIITIPSTRALPGLRRAADRGIPVVAIDWPAQGVVSDAVIIDNEEAAALAAERLVDRGHRRIAFIGNSSTWTLRARERGARRQLARRQVSLNEDFIISTNLSVEGGRSAMQKLLLLKERPTAVICATDATGVGALTALAESGLRVPDDMSFVGFDMRRLARMTDPALDTVSQRVDDLARAATDLMLMRLDPDAPSLPPQTVVLHAEYVAGGSVASLRRS